MKRILLVVLSIVALVSALVLGTTAVASADTGSQTWYLNSVAHPIVGLVMVKDDMSGLIVADMTIPPNNGYVIWLADQAAAANVTFSGMTYLWGITLSTHVKWSLNCTTVIGEWNPSTNQFTPFPEQTAYEIASNYQDMRFVAQTLADVTVPVNHYLALKIINTSLSNKIIVAGPGSFLNSPDSDPGYPLPELAAGILLGGGLVGLVGYVAIRRRRAGATTL